MDNKKTFLLIILTSYLLLPTPIPVLAQQTEYQLLAPLPGYVQNTTGNKTNASLYITGIFTLIIAIAGLLAVIAIIFGGIKYMSTDAFTGKSEAKATIEHAIWGLLLAVSAWLILNTINPNLVNFNFGIAVQPIATITTPTSVLSGPSLGQPWPDDSAVRSSFAAGVTFNKTNCLKIGDIGCTSVYGMSSYVISGVGTIAQNCNCIVIVNGGTEYWLHGNNSTELTGPTANPTQHKPGGNVVDLSSYPTLDSYIRATGVSTQTTGCSNLGTEKYTLNGATYVNEATHWHICF